MNKYSNWSTEALQGYLVMLQVYMSGTISESMLKSYQLKEIDAERELSIRSIKEAELAHPKETWVSGSVDQHTY